MKPQKRKQEQTDVSAKKRQICILHCEEAKSDGFTYLSDLMLKLEQFTCVMYGKSRFQEVDEVRVLMIREKCGDKPLDAGRNIDLGKLPPCRNCLEQHIRRANYQAAVWKRSHIADPNIPDDMQEHGWTYTDGVMEPLWISGDILPKKSIGSLQEALEEDSDDEDDDEPCECEDCVDSDIE